MELVKELNTDQLERVLQFFHALVYGHNAYDRSNNEQELQRRLEEFYAAETKESGQPRNRLAAPGGPPDAILGIILHVQSEEDIIDEFWDPRSNSINLLQGKGFTSETDFGYDWHWRAQGAFHLGGHCPTSRWSRKLIDMHDRLSADILDMLRLPLIVTGSSCTRVVLKFDLDFRGDILQRIILHLPHPVAAFFEKKGNKMVMGFQIDSGINLFLWMLGRSHSPDFFINEYTNPSTTTQLMKTAPLVQLWSYIKKERIENRKLRLEEYSRSFVDWTRAFLCRDPSEILHAGDSLAQTTSNKINSRPSRTNVTIQRSQESFTGKLATSNCPFELSEQNIPQSAQRYASAVNEHQLDDLAVQASIASCHGAKVHVSTSGIVTISAVIDSLHFIIGREQANRILQCGGEPELYLGANEIEIQTNGNTMYKTSIEELLSGSNGAAWLNQISQEERCLNELPLIDGKDVISPERNLDLSSFRAQGTAHRNHELKRELLDGARFHCGNLTSKGVLANYRVYFRGVQITIPLEADPEDVTIQASLVAKGCTHEHPCVTNAQTDDPSQRLGIMVTYAMIAGESKSFWSSTRGPRNIMKLNSLVDFLEDKEEGWTEKQPRRFLDRHEARGRSIHILSNWAASSHL